MHAAVAAAAGPVAGVHARAVAAAGYGDGGGGGACEGEDEGEDDRDLDLVEGRRRRGLNATPVLTLQAERRQERLSSSYSR